MYGNISHLVNKLSKGIINPGVLLSPLSTKEAVISSKIEGTQASLEEVLKYEASPDIKTEKYDDIREIMNYREAMRFAIQWMKEKPITLNLIKQMHGALLDGVRGKDRGRGNFRTSQNYIGKPGAPIEQARYIPPDPLILMEHLSNFEKYFHYDEKDRLVQLAIVHAQKISFLYLTRLYTSCKLIQIEKLSHFIKES